MSLLSVCPPPPVFTQVEENLPPCTFSGSFWVCLPMASPLLEPALCVCGGVAVYARVPFDSFGQCFLIPCEPKNAWSVTKLLCTMRVSLVAVAEASGS